MRYLLSLAAILLLFRAVLAQTAPAAVPPSDTFLFTSSLLAPVLTRPNPQPGSATTGSTLMLARITPDAIKTQTLLTTGHDIGDTPSLGSLLVVSAGKIYFEFDNELDCFDLATRQSSCLCEDFRTPTVHEGRIYFSSLAYGPRLRVFDPASQSAMDIVKFPNPLSGNVRKMVFSPDGKYIACIQPQNGGGPNAWQLGLVDLHARTATSLIDKLPFTPPSLRILGMSPLLIAWRDNQTILTVTDDLTAPIESPAFLTAIDITTKQTSQLCALPAFGGVTLFPQTANSELAITVIPPPGNNGVRVTLDKSGAKLREGPTQFGAFQLQGAVVLGVPQAVLFEAKPIATDRIPSRSLNLSPDGMRFLYTASTGNRNAELRCFDAATHTDRSVAAVDFRASTSCLWIPSPDLLPPATPAKPPEGFTHLEPKPFTSGRSRFPGDQPGVPNR